MADLEERISKLEKHYGIKRPTLNERLDSLEAHYKPASKKQTFQPGIDIE